MGVSCLNCEYYLPAGVDTPKECIDLQNERGAGCWMPKKTTSRKHLSSHAVLAEVRSDIKQMIDFEREETKGQPWMKQAQYRLAGLEDALAVIDEKIS